VVKLCVYKYPIVLALLLSTILGCRKPSRFEDAFGMSLPFSMRILSEQELSRFGDKTVKYAAIIVGDVNSIKSIFIL
jgi:hypothetical protein